MVKDDRPLGKVDRKLLTLIKTRIQQEICGEDDSFRTLLGDLKKNPGNATIEIAALTYLINIAGLPIPIETSLATASSCALPTSA